MAAVSRPSKERVRDYMDRRTHETDPPPTPADIRRELGWVSLEAEREERDRRERSE